MIADDPHLELRLASSERDLRAAQRLRYRVFVEELGGDGDMVDHPARLERDEFDTICDHLLLIDRRRDAGALEDVVGVYRLLPGDRAAHAGRFYCDSEYDLGPLRSSGRRLLELGRSCVHPDFRGGSAVFLLWSGLADYVLAQGIELLFGVASFHGTDVEALAQPLSYLHAFHLAPEDLRVRARPCHAQRMDLVPAGSVDRRAAMLTMPPLIKAYLRLGGFVGEGAWVDHAFNTTDVCLLLDTARMSTRHRDFYARRAVTVE
ncbi:GNAT family N-acetyltransferase [Cereibacter azotoformans]|uniref:L-ornithine N(alpha)-acyltransferase n=1 Tax=Cereibacter azotoformans TaxID=43057 RepID=A0A2T5JPW5_9RHOB|nr:GNAT family N-acyltransferase [Cereibacter azotoformans]AXQ95696.1 GNAT family N-acetyltransferase [Cereibacter sphaeroides]PTR09697.1 ornithine-acyl[acyl carrier protein] N-acyltransferase [Cereibacter azotoformans]UIJ32808.1 GNAT family N-acetyltransferase [Cereibacter azotoformans]